MEDFSNAPNLSQIILPENWKELARDQQKSTYRELCFSLLTEDNQDLKENHYYLAYLDFIYDSISTHYFSAIPELETTTYTEEEEKEFGKLPKCELIYLDYKYDANK